MKALISMTYTHNNPLVSVLTVMGLRCLCHQIQIRQQKRVVGRRLMDHLGPPPSTVPLLIQRSPRYPRRCGQPFLYFSCHAFSVFWGWIILSNLVFQEQVDTYTLGHVSSVPKEQNLPTLFNEGENSQVMVFTQHSLTSKVKLCIQKLCLYGTVEKFWKKIYFIFFIVHRFIDTSLI